MDQQEKEPMNAEKKRTGKVTGRPEMVNREAAFDCPYPGLDRFSSKSQFGLRIYELADTSIWESLAF